MRNKVPNSIIFILALGGLLAFLILRMETPTSIQPDGHGNSEGPHEEEHPRGPHGGWLFAKDDFQLEVTIFEKGIPPQFRVYPTDPSGKPLPLNEVGLKIELHRLDRIDKVQFKPENKYLLGNQTVVEPHSFEVKVLAQWRGKKYEWSFSQIEARAEFSDEAIKNAGITLETSGPGKINNILRLTGEIGLNEEKVVHIVPRLDGVVRKVFKDLGDRVKKGELLAILESRELADAKINYLGAAKQSKLANADLERERLIYKNTKTMLALLAQHLELEKIYTRLNDLVIGENRELIIPAYSKLQLTKSVYLREKRLHEKEISSESEYLLAMEDYKSAEARYVALREKIAYDGGWAVRQKKRTAEMAELNRQTATQKLLALRLTKLEIMRLDTREEQVFTHYELRSSLSGTIIQKHLTTGEAVKKNDNIFLLANLSDVWVNIAIPADDIKAVKLGQSVRIKSESLGIEGNGKLIYLGSIVDQKTRSVTGRVVLSNPKKLWRPGTFVSVDLIFEERAVPLAIRMEAIQSLRDWSVVFVKYGNTFEARPLELGANDGTWVEVLEGLPAGETYVVGNSFSVKAEIEKSGAVHQH